MPTLLILKRDTKYVPFWEILATPEGQNGVSRRYDKNPRNKISQFSFVTLFFYKQALKISVQSIISVNMKQSGERKQKAASKKP